MGAAGLLTGLEEKAMQTLLILDSIRGTDSTGVAVVPRVQNADVKIAKQVGNPFELFDHPSYTKAFAGANRVVIGHNRYGTRGQVSRKNAHPFDFDSIVGAHNGTLTSKHKLIDHLQFDVDSANLFHHINENGLHSALEHLEGAWALTWWDKIEETMNFLRNNERPLFLARNKENTCIFWASEKWMLEVALPRHRISIDNIIELAVDTHMSFAIDSNGKIEKPHAVEAKSRAIPFKYTPHTSTQGTGPSFTVIRGGEKVTVGVGKNKPTASLKKTLVLSPKDSYTGSKNVRLEVVGLSSDMYGAEYHSCIDNLNRDKLIRLYLKPSDEALGAGEEIFADIGPLIKDPNNGLQYYKVVHSSIKLCNPRSVKEKKYPDADGVLLTQAEFYNKYSGCAWCTGFVDPDKAIKFTFNEGEAVCHDCAADPELGMYVRFR